MRRKPKRKRKMERRRRQRGRRRTGAARSALGKQEPQWDADLPRDAEAIRKQQREVMDNEGRQPFAVSPGMQQLPDGSKIVHLSEPLAKFLRLQQQLFRAVFGREPARGDPTFWDTEREAEGVFPVRYEKHRQAVQSAAVRAGVRPEIAYAMRKTGMVLTRHNQHLFTDEELEEWQDAVEEYEEVD